MSVDISGKTFDQRKNYNGFISEQGRVNIDSDENTERSIYDRRLRTTTLDIVGRCVVPRETPDAFHIAIDAGNLTIGKGRIYIDGIQAENHGLPSDLFDPVLSERTGTDHIPFDQQLNLQANSGDDLVDGRYLVYLDVWQREVTYIEDPTLIEKAIGIPTTSRTQNIWQVKVLDPPLGDNISCATPDELVPGWEELIQASNSRLTTRAVGVPDVEDPCLIPPGGGYRGLENRTYFFAIHLVDNDGTAFVKWARNGSVVSTVIEMPSLDQLVVDSIGKDDILKFKDGDWVEVLDDVVEFSDQPGIMRKIEVDDAPNTLNLSESLPDDFFQTDNEGNLLPERHTRVRRWDQSGEIRDADNNLIIDLDADDSEGLIPVPLSGATFILEDGVQVSLTLDNPTGRFKQDDYWRFKTRTIDASVEELNNEPPCGIHHHYCRLALVEVVNGEFAAVVEDCRVLLPEPQVVKGCCNVTVFPHESIQEAVNNLPVQGGKICLVAGEYRENIVIENRRNITLTGCGNRTRLVSVLIDDAEVSNPVIDIISSSEILVDSFVIEANTTAVGIRLEEGLIDPNNPTTFEMADVQLINLQINASGRSAIEAQTGRNITIQACHILMEDFRSDWPGIFVIGEDVLIQENEILVLPVEGESSVQNGRGGIQIGGTSERVQLKNNLIRAGIGSGITLGSLEEVNELGFLIIAFIPWGPGFRDQPCAECEPVNPRIPPLATGNLTGNNGNGDDRHFRSAGPLYDITVEHNRIFNMGLNGIGVAGFFDLNAADEFISIENMAICHNEIRSCLRRPLAAIDADMVDSMGYGGIALADVENLIICHNQIENNGPSFLEPVCGIFVLHAVGGVISDNRIVNNGAKFNTQEQVKVGRRGGIHIVLAIAPTLQISLDTGETSPLVAVSPTESFPRQNGVPAIKIHDNIVSHPVGRALVLSALGPVSVQNNQFTTRGVPNDVNNPEQSSVGSTVIIVNLGMSNELFFQLLNFSGMVSGGNQSNFTNALEAGDDLASPEGLDDFSAGQYLSNGNLLFCNNQCVLDLLEIGLNKYHSSIVLYSLDDIGFHDNQCDCNQFQHFLTVQAFVMGFTVRVSNNRLKERALAAGFSATTIGFMNMTTNNQATHCLNVTSYWPNAKVETGNRILIESFNPGFCNRFQEFVNMT